jgi:hypothetical protein
VQPVFLRCQIPQGLHPHAMSSSPSLQLKPVFLRRQNPRSLHPLYALSSPPRKMIYLGKSLQLLKEDLKILFKVPLACPLLF